MQHRRNMQKLTPYEKPEAFLKREVYGLVCRYLDAGTEGLLRRAIESEPADFPQSPSFSENPFHWVFQGLRGAESVTLKRYQVSRFGRQLLYARRHRVPPEFLIGFLFQCGSPDAIYKKAGADDVEPWLGAYLERTRRVTNPEIQGPGAAESPNSETEGR